MRPAALKLYLLLTILVPRTFAQTTTPPAQPTPYAAESIVVEHLDTVFTFAPDGTGTQERTLAIRVQSEAAVRALGVVSIPYAGNTEQVEILYARVRRPDGSVIDTDTTGSLEMPEPVTREAPFYSDLKEKQLPIRSLRVGDTLEWKARITRTKAEAPGQFWGTETFTDSAVSLAETLELRIPATTYVNVWSPAFKPVETSVPATATTPAQHIYHWTFSQLKPTAGKEAEAAAEAKKKTVWTADQELDADQGKLPSVQWTTFKTWEDVGAWYHTLEADRAVAGPEIKSKVAELIAGKSTDEEKVRALYAYVATQIRYIGVDFGIGRYQPHTASEILSNQYGDCKDKHTLLAAMLSAAGIPADAVLIGAGVRFNPAVPSPASFNHLITHLTLSGAPGKPAQPVWLDATAEIAPYRMLYPVIRDKQALVVPATGPGHLDRTPADPPFPSTQTMDAVGSLNKDGISHSRLTLVFRGDEELDLRAAFRQVSPAQYDQLVQQISRNMGYGGTTSNAEVTRPEDTAVPFQMSYDYEREKAGGDWDDLKTIPQLAPIALPRFDDKDPLVRSLDLGAPRVETSHSAMKLPDNWGAVFPEAVHLKSPYVNYDQTYRFDKGTIYSERRIEVLKQKVPQADLKTYKKWADDAGLGGELYIQLIQHDPPKISKLFLRFKADQGSVQSYSYILGLAPGEAGGNTKADDLIRSAFDSVKSEDLDAARKSLDQARALSPEQLGLWSVSGLLALKTHAWTDVIADFEKELKLHPDQTTLYVMLTTLEKSYGTRKELIDTLGAWIAQGNADTFAYSDLIESLTLEGDPTAAIAVGQLALTTLSQDKQKEFGLHLAMGTAQLKAGQQPTAFDTLTSLIHDSQNPLLLNEVAYNMAEASPPIPQTLPLAESAARSALDQLEQKSQAITLDRNISSAQANSRLIQAVWDTLGWVYFREGKLPEAQDYIEAAWHGNRGATEAFHLGEVLLARGDKPAALEAFKLALATEATYDSSGARNPPSELEKSTQQHIDELLNAGVKFNSKLSPEQQLVDLFKIPLGPAKGVSGIVEYRLLLKQGKLIKAQPTRELPNAERESLIGKADFSSLFPANSSALLLRLGYINCNADLCELTLEP